MTTMTYAEALRWSEQETPTDEGRHGRRIARRVRRLRPGALMHEPAADTDAATARPSVQADGIDREAGLATAEYAIATVAAAGFAGLLFAVLSSGEVRELLTSIIRSALSVG